VTAVLVILHIQMTDALRLPSGVVTPPADPLTIYVQAPKSWVKDGAITDAGKKAVLAKMYGPTWESGNDDGSAYVVKAFTSKVLPEGASPTDGKRTWWYVVTDQGGLEKAGPGFGAPVALKQPKSLVDQAEPGSVWKQGPAVADAKKLTAWLAEQKGLVKLPATLKRGQIGFVGKGAVAGGLTFDCDDTGLGISLEDRARQACGTDAKTCALWVVGKWKAPGTLWLTKTDGAWTPGELSAHAWSQ
jgi:hypothetical protein